MSSPGKGDAASVFLYELRPAFLGVLVADKVDCTCEMLLLLVLEAAGRTMTIGHTEPTICYLNRAYA
jgi:hypothetical protein